ncbi:hypothetical protein [Kordia jejudonensis]|uniref:hypothetical protein n=1 Tax=Kordia jejudonensis TaxID=1348245 RepID=UPI000629CE12|nr:hypothetical protein [Kordia jejudonensis]
MNNDKIEFKRKPPVIKIAFGVFTFAVGAISVLAGGYYGLIVCGISMFFLHKDGTEIDLTIEKYRTFIEVLGFRFGKWDDLPEIDYVSVFSTTETITIRSRSAEANVKSDVIVLNLFYNGNHRIKAYTTKNKEDAFEKAKQIAEVLKIDILDATEAESKWL